MKFVSAMLFPILLVHLMLTYHTASASSCKILCQVPESSPTLFSINQKDLILKRTHCNVTRTDPAAADSPQNNICEVDLKDTLGAVANVEGNIVHYNTLKCIDHTFRITFINPSNISNKQVIGYFHSSNCDIYWTDLAFYANAIDLRVLYLEKWIEYYEEERERFEDISVIHPGGLNELPESLQTVGTFWLMNGLGQLPKVILNYLWPNMAEVIFNHMALKSIPEQLRNTMPLLQSLELPQNKLEEPPLFPWNQEWKTLPLNLSRTANGNHHYTVSQGFETPPNLYRRVLELNNNNMITLDSFSFTGCLQKINLAHNAIKSFSTLTFNSVECLERIDLRHNKLKSIPSSAFVNLKDLTSLDLSHNQINIPLHEGLFQGLVKLQKIDISHNGISIIHEMAFYPMLQLAELNLGHNQLTTIPNNAVNSNSDKLIKVIFESNNLTHIPHWVFLLRNLQDINMKNNQLDFHLFRECIKSLDAQHIAFNNRWSASQYSLVPQRAQTKYLYMQNNRFNSLDISNMEAEQLKVFQMIFLFFNLDLSGNTLNCDCHMYSMYNYLRNQAKNTKVTPNQNYNPYAEENWLCSAPASVVGEPITQVKNTTFKCKERNLLGCPKQCDCYRRSVDDVVEVDCSHKGLTAMPHEVPHGTQILNMAYNVLNELDLPPRYIHNLTELNFSHNNISYVSMVYALALNGKEEVLLHYNKLSSIPTIFQEISMGSISLHNNRWSCDCNALWFKRWLLTNRYVVQDLDEVLCFSGRGSGDIVIIVHDDYFVCEVPTSVVIAKSLTGVAAFLLAFLIIFFLAYRFRGEIKIFLYVHFKWHPFDRSEDTDIDFDYDAFVSYAGDDYKWVVYKLVARLESHIPPFKLCLHDRDFEVGAPIEQNIMRAVKQSRRMIIVLTRNFLQSDWCLLEFRAAHERVLHDRSNYIIMVLFDDISVDELHDDMQLYVNTNTYLSLSNKWFWEKLEYAMPKQPLCKLRDDVTFDFPCITAPPKVYPEYMKDYVTKDTVLADGMRFQGEQNENDSKTNKFALSEA